MLDSTNGRLLTISGASVNAVANAAYLTLLGNQGFDISPLDDTAFYAAKGFGADATTLYRMNLRTAATTSLGSIFTRPTGTPVSIRSLAVASPGVFRFASGPTAVPEQAVEFSAGRGARQRRQRSAVVDLRYAGRDRHESGRLPHRRRDASRSATARR